MPVQNKRLAPAILIDIMKIFEIKHSICSVDHPVMIGTDE